MIDGFTYLFPAKHESWDAGNVYMGEYSENAMQFDSSLD